MIDYIKILSIEETDDDETYDIWNYDDRCQNIGDGGNFFIDNILVHNSIPEAVANRDDPKQRWKSKLKSILPRLYEILKDTYGIILYQEQLQAMWQELAGFTAPEAQEARKAVAKKWTHKLKPIKDKWIKGASKTIGVDNAIEYWDKMETFGRYAFNRCLSKNTLLIDAITDKEMTVGEWYNSGKLPILESYVDGEIKYDKCVVIHDNGEQEVYEIEFDDGSREMVTLWHRFLCEDGRYHEIREIVSKGLDVIKAEN